MMSIDVTTRHRRDERGVIIVLFAISITMMLTVAALVLGSSVGYTAVRKAQNAADAAAAAATATLERVQEGSEPASAVLATAIDVAEDNGATSGSVECSIVTARYAVDRSPAEILGPCTTANVASSSAAGVRVTAEDTRDVPFASFVDRQDLTARATAAATVQPIRELSIRSPFLVCATAPGHGTPLLAADASRAGGWRVNKAAIGNQIQIWANGNDMRDGGRSCGAPHQLRAVLPGHGGVRDHLHRRRTQPVQRRHQVDLRPDDHGRCSCTGRSGRSRHPGGHRPHPDPPRGVAPGRLTPSVPAGPSGSSGTAPARAQGPLSLVR